MITNKTMINIKHDDFRRVSNGKQKIIQLTPELFGKKFKKKNFNLTLTKIKKPIIESPPITPITPQSDISSPSTYELNELDSRTSTLSDDSEIYLDFGLVSQDHIEMMDMLNSFTNKSIFDV